MYDDELLELARQYNVSNHYLRSEKSILIKAIQKAQGQEPCYMSDLRYTCTEMCEWNHGCRKLTAEWLR